MNKVTITPLKGQPATKLINTYDANPEFAYLRVVQSSLDFSNPTRPRKVTKSAFIKGDVETLEMVVESSGEGYSLEGQIAIQEYTPGNVPAWLKKDFYFKNEDKSYDEQRSIDALAKKAGSDEDALPCTLNGEPILRFSFYDATYAHKTVLIAHDNGQEISELALAKKNAEATLPGAGEN